MGARRAPVTLLWHSLAHRCPPRLRHPSPRERARARPRGELHARARLRRPRRQPPRAAERHSAAPNCRSPPPVHEERAAAAWRGDRWGGWGEQAIARRRVWGGLERGMRRGERWGARGSRARACAPRPWSLGAAEEVNIVQYTIGRSRGAAGLSLFRLRPEDSLTRRGAARTLFSSPNSRARSHLRAPRDPSGPRRPSSPGSSRMVGSSRDSANLSIARCRGLPSGCRRDDEGRWWPAPRFWITLGCNVTCVGGCSSPLSRYFIRFPLGRLVFPRSSESDVARPENWHFRKFALTFFFFPHVVLRIPSTLLFLQIFVPRTLALAISVPCRTWAHIRIRAHTYTR